MFPTGVEAKFAHPAKRSSATTSLRGLTFPSADEYQSAQNEPEPRLSAKRPSIAAAYEKGGQSFLEFYERQPNAKPVRKRISFGKCDRDQAKLKADELVAALRRGAAPQASNLTLHALFYNWYLKDALGGRSSSAIERAAHYVPRGTTRAWARRFPSNQSAIDNATISSI